MAIINRIDSMQDDMPGHHQALADRLAAATAGYKDPLHLTVRQVGALLDMSLCVLFPHFRSGRPAPLADDIDKLARITTALIAPLVTRTEIAATHVNDFLESLPGIAATLVIDAEALANFDPAAQSVDEVVLAYPGFRATAAYRLAHQLLRQKVPLLPRLITEYAHRKTGIDIHPGAQIGKAFCIDHGTAIVIGETAVIGDHVKLYQGVTLGGLSVKKERRGSKRHPSIEDNVIIYAGATILGGETVVGHDSIIGGNVWLTRSVPPWSRVMFKPCDTEEIVPTSKRPAPAAD